VIENHNYAVIVAGGSGTRLWPLSRKDLPKQVHKLITDKTLIEDTAERITAVVPYDHIFVSTTKNYYEKIRSILNQIPDDNIIVEPVARGTTAAFALFSETIYRRDPEATIISFASDHAISDIGRFRRAMKDAYRFVDEHPESVTLIGVTPTRADTGLGYIKVDSLLQHNPDVYSVEKFVEKPTRKVADQYVKSGEYFWNAAYYCFKAGTLIAAYEEADSNLMDATRRYMETHKVEDFEKVPVKPHEIEIINAQRFPLSVLTVSFGWSDVGSWGVLHDILSELGADHQTVVGDRQQHIDIDSTNCMVVANNQEKIVATIGLKNTIIVDTFPAKCSDSSYDTLSIHDCTSVIH
jgi:mannose-1-phosphate guanylyltransferase